MTQLNLMDSPAFTNYQVRFSRSNKIQKEVNMVNKRDNFYNDVIRTFQTAAQGGDESFIDINDKQEGLFKKIEPIKLQILGSIDHPKKTQVFFLPNYSWNYYDKSLFGLKLYNQFLPSDGFFYEINEFRQRKYLARYNYLEKNFVIIFDLLCCIFYL